MTKVTLATNVLATAVATFIAFGCLADEKKKSVTELKQVPSAEATKDSNSIPDPYAEDPSRGAKLSKEEKQVVLDQMNAVNDIWEKNKRKHPNLDTAMKNALKEVRALAFVESAALVPGDVLRLNVKLRSGVRVSIPTEEAEPGKL